MEKHNICPTCKQNTLPKTNNPDFPFCSKHCKQVDLGKWFLESYRIAVTPTDDTDLSSWEQDSSIPEDEVN